MKRLLAAAVGAVITISSLALVSPSAQAGDPYPGTIATALSVSYKARVHRGRIQRIQAEVITSGNVVPTGTVLISITRVKSGRTYSRSYSYDGVPATYLSPALRKRGLWTLSVTYSPPGKSVFKTSSYKRHFKVKKRKTI